VIATIRNAWIRISQRVRLGSADLLAKCVPIELAAVIVVVP